uniref:Uncharacterized protein n=1 Tax=Alexandrium monilatum TaxID=311494 RepID=A0A7S4RRD2_9DINO
MPSTYKAATYAASALWLEDSKVQYKPNPKWGKSFHRYAAYEKATTVGEALRFGAYPADLLFDFEKGHLTVSEPLREKPLDLFAMKSFEELTYTDKVLSRYTYLADPSKGGEIDSERIQVLEESIRKQRANMRRLRKIQIASVLEIKEVDSLADSTGFWESPLMMARRSLANQQAKEVLELLEAEPRKLTDFEVLSVLRLWDFRENVTRQNVMKPGQTFIYSDTVGLVADRTGHIVAKEETRRYPQFGQFLCRWLRDHTPDDLGADFVFTSININKNYAGRLHRDGSNVGPSCLKAFGDFKGGQLNYFAEDDRSIKLEVLEETMSERSVKLDVAHGLALFDGKRGHWVDEFEGERYSLVFFTCPRYDRMTDDTRQIMDAAGFPVPDEAKMAKLLTVLRRPRGYGEAKPAAKVAQAAESIHDAPFLFWAHDSPARAEQEAEAREYWQRRGLREPIVKDGPQSVIPRIEWEHRGNKRNVSWNEDHLYLVLPGEPTRKDLILEGYRNMVDAAAFLNDPESKVPKAITKEGCCAVFSNRTKIWYCLFRFGRKEAAMKIFGLEAELPQPKRSERAPAQAPAQQQTTPTRKRKQAGADGSEQSAKKQRMARPTPAATPKGRAGKGAAPESDPTSPGHLSLAKKLVKSARAKTAAQKKEKEEEGAKTRPGMSLDRRAVLQKLAACTGETRIELKSGGKTAESHSGSYKRYEGYQPAKTMQEALDLGAVPGDLIYDCQAGLLKILDRRPRGRPRKDAGNETPKSRFDCHARRWRETLAQA